MHPPWSVPRHMDVPILVPLPSHSSRSDVHRSMVELDIALLEVWVVGRRWGLFEVEEGTLYWFVVVEGNPTWVDRRVCHSRHEAYLYHI